jgi:cyclic pyranopterin phosphate synthase
MELKHVSPRGQARMVSVAGKAVTARSARAEAWVTVGPAIAAELRRTGSVAKGNVLETARLAGVMAAKRTSELIPICHPLALELVEVEASLEGDRVHIETHAACEGKTGVEMEALTAAAVAALTVYDMVKSAGKGVTIEGVRLLSKSGGKSGTWRRRGSARG